LLASRPAVNPWAISTAVVHYTRPHQANLLVLLAAILCDSFSDTEPFQTNADPNPDHGKKLLVFRHQFFLLFWITFPFLQPVPDPHSAHGSGTKSQIEWDLPEKFFLR
jgi:hypothetical protein